MPYTYDEVYAASLKYFGGEDLPAKVFVDKQALRSDAETYLELTPDDMHRRIAREFARVEARKFKQPFTEDQIYDWIKNFGEIIPQGSPMFGIGNKFQYVTLSNCYVIGTEPEADSYGGIHRVDEYITQISKRRGGVGLDVSHLRPKGSRTRNSSHTSTGILPFMERYSNSIREVGQNGRRGALMITCSVHHPEIVDFARVKKDRTKVTGANISVRLSDEFLNAVANDTDYEQRWPLTGKPQVSRMVNARKVWEEIIECAWEMAEPGLVFWDRILSESPADCYGHNGFNTVSLNPCRLSTSTVLTKHGIRTIADIKIGDEIWSESGWTKVIAKAKTGIKEVFRYKTTCGEFECTDNHHIVSCGQKTPAKSAEAVDFLRGPQQYVDISNLDPQVVMDGVVFGDGGYKADGCGNVVLFIGHNDQDYFNSEISGLIIRGTNRSKTEYYVQTTITHKDLDYTFQRKIPQRFFQGDSAIVQAFLRGLYSANGSVCGNRVTLKATSFDVIKNTQRMLASLGIGSYYTTNKSTVVRFKNGNYQCKQSYDLNIAHDRHLFQKYIGFIQSYKNAKLQHIIDTVEKSPKAKIVSKTITSSESLGKHETWEIAVDNDTRTYWSDNFNVSNCAELPLCMFDSCRLLLLNTLKFVQQPFTKEAKFDFDRFYQYSKYAQRLMDDLVDLELEAIDRIIDKIENDPEQKQIKAIELDLWKRIREKCSNGRRTGTGITALGDAIAALGIKYGSDESIELTGAVYDTLKWACYEASVDMAEELGPFPIWDAKLETDNPFLLRLKAERPEIYDRMQKVGRRNIALLTTAPAGTVSILANVADGIYGTTSGIEPVFMLEFKRRKKINHSDSQARVDFTDQNGDKWQEFVVYHPAVKLWQKVTGKTDVKESPWYGACAEDINWENRVKLQARANLSVDHAISSTINLPENVTQAEVAKIYETAWRAGCKGITVYRKNCRTGVLVEKDKKEVTKDAAKRPESLPGDVYHIKAGGTEFLVVVGLLNEQPYEVMAAKNGVISKKAKHGMITKQKRGHYSLICDTGETLDSITSLCEDMEEALTRMISTSLRHNVPIDYIVHQLEKTKGTLQSFAKAVSRCLKKYVKDGTKVTGSTCPDCGSTDLKRQEGCISCSCGYSKCM